MKQIYKTVNLINNKIYIGQHNGKRDSYLGSGKRLKYAINKYGRNNFKKTILIEGDFEQGELDELEQYYIKLYNSNNPKIGYNLTKGGLGWLGTKLSTKVRKKMSDAQKNIKRKPLTEEHKHKLRIAKLGKHQSKETILKRSISLSKALTGRKCSDSHIEAIRNSHIGKKMPEEQKLKISISNTNNPKNSKKIYCYNKITNEFIKEYPSINQAARELDVSVGNICSCLKGIFKTSAGYKWTYGNQ